MNNENLHPMITFLALLSAALFAFFIAFFFACYAPLVEENKKMQRSLDYYDSTYLHKSGWTSFMGGEKGLSYDLRSWDCGRNWYAVKLKRSSDAAPWELIILGEADSIYPNLVKHLEATDRLTEYARKNGAIGSSGKVTDEEIKMLEDSGFEVKRTDKAE